MGVHGFIGEAISDRVLCTRDVFENAAVEAAEKEGGVVIERPQLIATRPVPFQLVDDELGVPEDLEFREA